MNGKVYYMINEITHIVEEVLGEKNIKVDEDLIALGKINSILVIEIIEKIETLFKINLDEANITYETFRSVANLVNLVKEKR
jgi:acyl carrier protein